MYALSRRLRPRSLAFLRAYASSPPTGNGLQDATLHDPAATMVSTAGAGADAVDAASTIPTPVEAMTTLLDGIHSVTGAPWWIVIAGSTVAMKAMLFPLTVVQLQKLSKFAEFTKQCPIFPKPGSGKNMGEHFREFEDKRRELGAPSPFWFLAAPSVQLPLFITWVMTVRKMAVNLHPGFDSGGALWFTDLTVPIKEHLGIGYVFPVLIVATYLANIEASWMGVKMQPGAMGSMISTYRWWLRACTVPIYISSFYFPQAVFMYWLPNSITSLMQTLSLRNKSVRQLLGLPIHHAPPSEKIDSDALIKRAAQHVAENDRKTGYQILQYIVSKEPENATAYYALGKMHAEAELWVKAAKFFRAAATKAKQDTLKISATLSLGIAYRNQAMIAEATDALQEVVAMDAPEDLEARKSYVMTLVCLASILNNEGNKLGALEHLQKAAQYDPKIEDFYVKPILQEIEADKQSAAKPISKEPEKQECNSCKINFFVFLSELFFS